MWLGHLNEPFQPRAEIIETFTLHFWNRFSKTTANILSSSYIFKDKRLEKNLHRRQFYWFRWLYCFPPSFYPEWITLIICQKKRKLILWSRWWINFIFYFLCFRMFKKNYSNYHQGEKRRESSTDIVTALLKVGAQY